jgi:hypothetical protein
MQTADLYALILTFSRWEKELFRLLRLPPNEAVLSAMMQVRLSVAKPNRIQMLGFSSFKLPFTLFPMR